MSQHDDLFQELGRTLDVAPSRDFADGVRSRIARRRLIMRTTMSGLAIAASLLLVVVARWPDPAERSPRALALGTVAGAEAPALHQDPLTPGMPARQVRRAGVVQEVAEAEPDRLQVVTNQMAVLQAIWADQRVTAGETEAPLVEAATTTELAPVVIEPVVVLPVVIADQRTPTEGLPIIRRAVAALETK